jgi:hypothetical protein
MTPTFVGLFPSQAFAYTDQCTAFYQKCGYVKKENEMVMFQALLIAFANGMRRQSTRQNVLILHQNSDLPSYPTPAYTIAINHPYSRFHHGHFAHIHCAYYFTSRCLWHTSLSHVKLKRHFFECVPVNSSYILVP